MELPIVNQSRDTGLYHCISCDRGFKQKSNAKSHYKTVHENVKKQCLICGLFVKKHKSHVKEVHGKNLLVKCQYCDKRYYEGRLYKDHLKKTHFVDSKGNPVDKFYVKCDICGEKLLKSRLERHLRLSHYIPENFTNECPICGSQVKFLRWHIKNYHKDIDSSRDLYCCNKCDQWFLTQSDLNLHIYNHRKYNCEDCNSITEFESYTDLAKHMHRSHGKISLSGSTFDAISSLEALTPSTKYLVQKGVITSATKVLEENSVAEADLVTTVVVDEDGEVVNDQVPTEDDDDDDQVKNITEDVAEAVDTNINIGSVDPLSLPCEDGTKLFEIVIPALNTNEFQISVDVKQLPMPTDHPGISPKMMTDDHLMVEKLSERYFYEQELLENIPTPQKINLSHLSKLRIGSKSKKSEDRNSRNKIQFCPSRQSHLCPYCRKILKTKDALSRHIAAIHELKKPHKCTYCDKSFSTNADVSKHIKASHASDRNEMVECDECHELVRKPSLSRHKSYRHNRNKLTKICDKCGKDFKTREIMLKHARTVHNQAQNTTLNLLE